MTTVTGRALHFVFKIADRKQTSVFYRDILGMKVLRHEEFSEGCEAACNGPYKNTRWSKTMMGYGPEDNYFVVELTYNYGISEYEQGNDFLGITIKSKEALARAKSLNWPIENGNCITAPGGYKFYLLDESQPIDTDPVVKVALASSNLQRSIDYWHGVLNLNIIKQSEKSVELAYSPSQARLELVDIGQPVNHAKAYGRIAFSCDHDLQPALQKKVEEAKGDIIKQLISLPTPGKADVRVIILADPDGHEICFVDDEAFRELSQVDPEAEKLYERYMKVEYK